MLLELTDNIDRLNCISNFILKTITNKTLIFTKYIKVVKNLIVDEVKFLFNIGI